MEPVIDENKEADENVPKQLAVLTSHTKSVNSVRWAGNGLWLASASDDLTIIVWQQRKNWHPQFVLRGGHTRGAPDS